MLNALGGVPRAIARLRPEQDPSIVVRQFHRRAIRITRQVVDRLVPVPTRRRQPFQAPRHLASHRTLTAGATRMSTGRISTYKALARRWRLDRRLLRVRLGSERALPMAIALVVIVASIVSLGPAAVRPVGAAEGATTDLRLAIGGQAAAPWDDPELDAQARTAARSAEYVDDGTFYKPVAVDTTVESGSDLLRHYTVRSGDTLTGIASKFDVSMMTLYWANKLDGKDSLHVGQSLVIPPVNGLIVTVKVGDSLDSLAAQYKVDPAKIVELNELSDPALVVGQVLILPGAKGAPIPTAAATPRPTTRTTTSSSSGSGTTTTRTYTYTGGAWAWPVVGGGNYISQYFHYGHYGVDIAAKYGTPVVAPLGGTIVFAGWKSNGGGYQVWIYHGNNLYTQSCHLSAVLVRSGQSVGKGSRVGSVGSSGWATGPHDHFTVSIGIPFGGGSYFVNPLRYY